MTERRKVEQTRGEPGEPQMIHRPPYVPKLHSSHIRTSVSGRTYESQTGLAVVFFLASLVMIQSSKDPYHFPSHFSHNRPIACEKNRIRFTFSSKVNCWVLTNARLTPAHNQI